MRLTGQVLIFDADDTLWENNVLFERVIADFLDWLEHPTFDRVEIRAILDDIEAANAVSHGYGSKVFLRSLAECLERLYERPATARERRRIDELAVTLIERRVELVPGVAETLTDLGTSCSCSPRAIRTSSSASWTPPSSRTTSAASTSCRRRASTPTFGWSSGAT